MSGCVLIQFGQELLALLYRATYGAVDAAPSQGDSGEPVRRSESRTGPLRDSPSGLGA